MVVNAETERVIRRVLGDMLPKLNEMQRRQLQGSIADALGHGGVAYVNSLTGAARNTISRGIEDLNSIAEAESADLQTGKIFSGTLQKKEQPTCGT